MNRKYVQDYFLTLTVVVYVWIYNDGGVEEQLYKDALKNNIKSFIIGIINIRKNFTEDVQ